jgi:hypothetical protein
MIRVVIASATDGRIFAFSGSQEHEIGGLMYRMGYTAHQYTLSNGGMQRGEWTSRHTFSPGTFSDKEISSAESSPILELQH